MNPHFRGQIHSYALARIMKHIIGFENFEAPDHAIHDLLIEDTRVHNWERNFRDILEERIKSRNELMTKLGESESPAGGK